MYIATEIDKTKFALLIKNGIYTLSCVYRGLGGGMTLEN